MSASVQSQSIVPARPRPTYRKIIPAIRKHILKKFSYLKATDVPDVLILSTAKKYKATDQNVSKALLTYLVNDIVESVQRQHRTLPTLSSSTYTKQTELKEYFISIDSKDRNTIQWPNPNEYCIDFGGIHNNRTQLTQDGYINSVYINIESIELVSVVVPKFSDTGDHVNNYPYLLLEIDEFGGIYDGSNEHVSNAFAKLRFQTDLGYFKEYTRNGAERFIKKFHPRISLNRLTIRFRKPDGTLYDFGNEITTSNTNTSTADSSNTELDSKLQQLLLDDPAMEDACQCPTIAPENTLVFRIVCAEKRMDTKLFKQ
jgi:hypothetical protein